MKDDPWAAFYPPFGAKTIDEYMRRRAESDRMERILQKSYEDKRRADDAWAHLILGALIVTIPIALVMFVGEALGWWTL